MNPRPALFERLPEKTRRLLVSVGEIADGRGESAWLVGGSVRDLLLERENEDVDVVVEGDGMAVAQEFARAHGGRLTRYHAFGTARVDLPDGGKVDFATARAEDYPQSGTLPKVRAGDLDEDLARRDFSINAIALRLGAIDEGRLADPFDGVGDLERRRVRFLHEGSFVDDPTRMLRALRFALRFDYRLEERTERALLDASRGGYLDRISGDRLRRELAKLLKESPLEGPLALAETELAAGIHPGLRAPRRHLERLVASAPEVAWPQVLAVMAVDLDAQERWALVRKLRLSRAQRAVLLDAGLPWRRVLASASAAEVDRLDLLEALDAVCGDALDVGLASLEDRRLADRIREVAACADSSRPELDGGALLELGCPAGPAVGEMLRRLRGARLAGEVHTAEGERALVRRWLDAAGEGSAGGDRN